MREHKVYKHESEGYAAVKVGFAWYGFFFSIIWLVFKSLFFWLTFITTLLIIFIIILDFSINTFFNPISLYSLKAWSMLLVVLAVPILVGLKGNKWLSTNLENKGYQLVEIIPSISKKEAIIQTQNVKSSKTPAFAAWGRQDSYQPGHRHIKKGDK
jgi:hypothetical protein